MNEQVKLKPKQWLLDNIKYFEPLINVPVSVQFGPHTFATMITEVKIAKLTDMVNKPEMRQVDGKGYTPPVLELVCGEDGTLFFVIEDIKNLIVTLNGLLIKLQDTEIRFSKA